MKTKALLLSVLAGVILAGCQSYFENPNFTVEESGLNWISVRYYNYKTRPIRKVNVRIDGNGIVDVKEGTSSLVGNPFANKMEELTWGDVRETRTIIPREEVVPILQLLVDNGLFKERHNLRGVVSTNESIFVTANIQCHTCGSSNDDIFSSDPELAEHLKNVVLMYYHPTPRRRK